MAKWGEGDPRWVVEDRQDGINVNGWHWEEKDRMQWTRSRIDALLTGLTANTAPLQAQLSINKIEKVHGEASVSQRKGGKLLAVFDLTLEMEWVGKIDGEADEVKGKIKISEFASHSDPDEYMLECTRTGTSADGDVLCKLAKDKLQPAVLAALTSFSDELLATL